MNEIRAYMVLDMVTLTPPGPDLALWANEPPSIGALVLGSSVYVVLGVLAAVALVGLPIGGVALLLRLAHLARAARSLRSRPEIATRERPALRLDGLTPGLARLARQTRTLVLELRHAASRADALPEDAGEHDAPGGWWSALRGEGDNFAPLLAARREAFDWLESAACLPDADRSTLTALGIDPEQVRAVLTRTGAPAGIVRDLAGLFHELDERLCVPSHPVYRDGVCAAQQPGRPPLSPPRAADAGTNFDPRPADARDDEAVDHGALLNEHRVGISSVARRYARSEAECQDLEQDIALEVWKALPSFRGESRLDTFVYRIARYRCYRTLRRRGRLEETGPEIEPVDEGDDPEALLLRADERHRLEQALERLPGTLGTALSLHLRGLSYAEIAAELGISERNVSVRLTRARRRLELELA